MPTPITLDTTILTWVGAIGTLVINAFVIGAVYGRLTSKITTIDSKVETIKGEIVKINQKFISPEGEPLLMTIKAHHGACTISKELISTELKLVTRAIEDHSKAVTQCGTQVGQLALTVAILEERFDNWQKQTKSTESHISSIES